MAAALLRCCLLAWCAALVLAACCSAETAGPAIGASSSAPDSLEYRVRDARVTVTKGNAPDERVFHYHLRQRQSHSDFVEVHATAAKLPFLGQQQDRIAEPMICADGTFNDSLGLVGWSFLEVRTSHRCSNQEAAFAAGYLEGSSTWERIYEFVTNEQMTDPLPDKVTRWLTDQEVWQNSQIQGHPSDPYWHQLSLMKSQFEGLYAGYAATAPSDKQLPRFAVELCTSGNDVGDVEAAVGQFRPSRSGNRRRMDRSGHCSALIKLLPDYSDLLIAQDTWSSLTSMTRIYKRYDFPFTLHPSTPNLVAAVNMSFTSYPGCLYSADDFYLTSAGLVVQETTIDVNNNTLYQYVVPETLFDWQRNMMANRLAHSAPDWADFFGRHNSGTYNNEFMVLDFKLFTPGSPPPPNTLWLLDQIPGYVEASDVTHLLRAAGYWPSYNIAYFPFIFNISGMPELVEQYGDFFSYERTPRALIFARNQSQVTDLDSMQALMRYNNFQHDPLAYCDCKPYPYSGENAISCRSDLNPADGTYPISVLGHRNHVGTDSKIASYRLLHRGRRGRPGRGPDDFPLVTRAISSPTYDQQPVFVWSQSSYSNTSHIGQPDRWQFPWLTVDWMDM